VLICVVAGAATGQVSFHAGLEAGVPVTDTLVSSSESSTSQSPVYSLFNRFNSETKRLLIGPTFRVETQSGIGFEVDALYQRVDSDFSALLLQPLAPAEQTCQQTTANRWQFPVLVQYSRKLQSVRWFAGAGPSLSHIGQTRPQITGSSLFGSPPSSATWGGITAGGGVDVRVSHLHLRPEFRYSHWFAGSYAITPSALVAFTFTIVAPAPLPGGASSVALGVPYGFFFPIHQNEASFLLGVTF
jgi:hypothetical protein